MVSRYVVDNVQIVGLLVGMAGSILLASGLFGKSGGALPRGLFVAAVYALLFGLATPAILAVAIRISNAPSGNAIVPPALAPWILAAGGFVVGLSWSGIDSRLSQMFKFVASLVLGTLTVLVSPYVSSLSAGFAVAIAGLAIVILFLVGSVAYYFALIMPVRQAQVIGLIATLAGSAAQFLPPVLNLLGIKIIG